MTNTQAGIGIRRSFVTFGERNFEPSGTVQYVAEREGLWFLGTQYHSGQTLPFDVSGTSYSKLAMENLELFWNQGWIKPLV